MEENKKNLSFGYFICLLLISILTLETSYGAVNNILTNPGFESPTNGSPWAARGCTFTTTTSQKHSGSRSGRATGRTETWQGIQQDVLGKMVVGQTYAVSGWARTSSSSTVHLSFQKTDGDGTTYAWAASGTAGTTWTNITGNYTLTANGTITELLVYIEGPASGVDIYLDDVNVFGEVPGPTNPSATGSINTNTRHQVLEGFGAAGTWYENYLTSNTQRETIYNILFRDLGIDIYRIRNTYDYDSGYMSNTGTIVGEALERNPNLKILISSWSPPTYLKSTGQLDSGTLAGGPSAYVYDDFADWWADSITAWSGYGVDIDYVSVQNEPDWNGNDRCLFDPTENSTNAGYDQAFEAVWQEFNSRWGSSMPKMLAPETSGFDGASGYSIDDYLSAIINHSHVYGYAHHLYNCENGGAPGCGDQPDLYISDMTNFNSSWGSKPLFQTEYEHATNTWPDALNIALLLHNSLTVEEVSVYLYWDLFWSDGGLVTLPSYGASTYTINSDYYGLKHFSRFTDPGWQRTDADTNSASLRISSFINPTNQKLSAIIINTDESTDIDLALSFTGFTVADGNVWRSTSSQNCVLIGSFIPGNQLSLPAKSITTLELYSTATPPPGKATSPSPFSGATGIGIATDLSWTAGSGATSHDVYFGTASPGTYRGNQTTTTYDTGIMANNTTYYWRIDERNAGGTTTGDVWSFTTIVAAPGKATSPSPFSGATGIGIATDLSWTAGSGATSHDVYFGTASPGTYRGNQTTTTYDTGIMANNTTYYWRIDERNAGGTTTGDVWSFTTLPAVPPAAPTGLVATAGNGSASLNWNDNSEADMNGYNVYRSTTQGSGYAKLNSSLLSSSDYIDNGLTNGISYYYVVTAVNDANNESGYSNEANAVPAYQTCADVIAGGHRLAADISGSGDCYVNYEDLATFVEYWLNDDCVSPGNCHGADFVPTDGVVDFFDFSDFGPQWMQCNNPQDVGCTPNW